MDGPDGKNERAGPVRSRFSRRRARPAQRSLQYFRRPENAAKWCLDFGETRTATNGGVVNLIQRREASSPSTPDVERQALYLLGTVTRSRDESELTDSTQSSAHVLVRMGQEVSIRVEPGELIPANPKSATHGLTHQNRSRLCPYIPMPQRDLRRRQ